MRDARCSVKQLGGRRAFHPPLDCTNAPKNERRPPSCSLIDPREKRPRSRRYSRCAFRSCAMSTRRSAVGCLSARGSCRCASAARSGHGRASLTRVGAHGVGVACAVAACAARHLRCRSAMCRVADLRPWSMSNRLRARASAADGGGRAMLGRAARERCGGTNASDGAIHRPRDEPHIVQPPRRDVASRLQSGNSKSLRSHGRRPTGNGCTDCAAWRVELAQFKHRSSKPPVTMDRLMLEDGQAAAMQDRGWLERRWHA